MEWNEGSFFTGQVIEVQDGEDRSFAANPEETGLLAVAVDYGAQSANQQTRTIMLRTISESGIGEWAGPFTIPESTVPLEELSWNGGWPQPTYIAKVDVVDDGQHFNAENPEAWSLERCARDYGDSAACENREPHEITIRDVTLEGSGSFVTFTVPMEPEE
jgi:hypothetical protein